MQITGRQELQKILLEVSINFFNINKLAESVVLGGKCNGCDSLSFFETGVLIKKACKFVSFAVYALKSVAETLLSSSCVIEDKISLANEVRIIACNIKSFLMSSSHLLSTSVLGKKVTCQCNNHKNIDILTEVFISIIDIK